MLAFSGKGRIWNSSQLFRALGSLLQNVDKQLPINGVPGAVGEVPRRLCAQDVWASRSTQGETGCQAERHYAAYTDVNSLSGNMRFFLSGESSHEASAVCFGPCAECVWKCDLMESVDYCFKILYWPCCLYFNLFLNCFLQPVSLPICALLCQRTDFPINTFQLMDVVNLILHKPLKKAQFLSL